MSDDTKRRRSGGTGGWYFGDCGGGWDAGDGAGIILLLILLILLAEVFLVYAIAIAFTYVLSLGDTHRAKRYFKKVKQLGLSEPEGTGIARRLDHTKIYFSIVFFVFAAEETVRFVLHTGPAAFEIWKGTSPTPEDAESQIALSRERTAD